MKIDGKKVNIFSGYSLSTVEGKQFYFINCFFLWGGGWGGVRRGGEGGGGESGRLDVRKCLLFCRSTFRCNRFLFLPLSSSHTLSLFHVVFFRLD